MGGARGGIGGVDSIRCALHGQLMRRRRPMYGGERGVALEDLFGKRLSRRTAIKLGVAGAVASELALLEQLAWIPTRAQAMGGALPDIQFDIGNFIAPPVTLNDGAGVIQAGFGPVFATFTPAKLTRQPKQVDQRILAGA